MYPIGLSDFAEIIKNNEDNINNIVIQQFIGLKDKNDKEIYEGDIVKWKHPMEDIGICEYVATKWFNAPYPDQCFYGLETERLGLCHFQDDDEYEIIGNIFENPELLK